MNILKEEIEKENENYENKLDKENYEKNINDLKEENKRDKINYEKKSKLKKK